MESIAVRNLSFRYPGAANETLRGVDFRLDASDFAVLIGATGSGKSTLLRLLIGPLAATSPRSFAVLIGATGSGKSMLLRLLIGPLAAASPRSIAVLIGATGSGKSMLLRLLKPELAPLGACGGEIRAASEAVPESVYGAGRRSRFALFRFRGQGVALIVYCLILSGMTIAAAATGALSCEFYPRFAMGEGGTLAAAGYACYALLALAPAILEWEEKLRWRALRSGT